MPEAAAANNQPDHPIEVRSVGHRAVIFLRLQKVDQIKGSCMSYEVKLTEEGDFLFELEELMNIERQNPLAGSPRRERVAEHSWFVAIAAILFRDDASQKIDLGRAVTLAVVHDVVETWAGDTFAFSEATADQFDREHRVMAELRKRTGSPGITRIIDAWQEYEDQESPEAQFVKGLDALIPIMQNYRNLDHSSWLRHHVKADKVVTRLNNHGHVGETWRAIADEMIESAATRGVLT
jgi:putative hydrolase of HD superfamily